VALRRPPCPGLALATDSVGRETLQRRAAPKRSRWRGATFETIRRAFVKVAVRVEELKGRIKLAFSASYPQAAMLVVMTGAITTRGP
jgi:hypothetical protein